MRAADSLIDSPKREKLDQICAVLQHMSAMFEISLGLVLWGEREGESRWDRDLCLVRGKVVNASTTGSTNYIEKPQKFNNHPTKCRWNDGYSLARFKSGPLELWEGRVVNS